MARSPQRPPAAPLVEELVPLAEASPRASPAFSRRRARHVDEPSAAYQTVCMTAALLVGAAPLLVVATIARPTRRPPVAHDEPELCSPLAAEPPSTNGSVVRGGVRVALALLLSEGPRGEHRRVARAAILAERERATREGLWIYAFEACALPPATSALLAGSSAAAACRLSRLVSGHSCATRDCYAAAAAAWPPIACAAAAEERYNATGSSHGLGSRRRLGERLPADEVASVVGCRLGCAAGSSRRPEANASRAELRRSRRRRSRR